MKLAKLISAPSAGRISAALAASLPARGAKEIGVGITTGTIPDHTEFGKGYLRQTNEVGADRYSGTTSSWSAKADPFTPSARLLEQLGFEALATTSGGLAFALGRPDGAAGRDATIANARAIVEANSLPVSADLENGFSASPQGVTETIRLAIGAGLAGGSIEDATGDPEQPIYDLGHAVKRVAAAVEAARAGPAPFTLTARAENFLHGRPDVDDTLRRLQAFEKAGADVLYAPGLPSLEALRAVCAGVSRPVNALAGGGTPRFTVAQFAEAGAKRVSLGALLSRAALGAMLAAAREVKEHGTFGFADAAMTSAAANGAMLRP